MTLGTVTLPKPHSCGCIFIISYSAYVFVLTVSL
uniref:Uncharacterized protein n=1 Tax=Siphoviridae sp. ctK0l2 TaxID=2826243 RepID=A0A8S5NJC6_9CAUD|nr:MAG TPA: protein of unknown function (DUF951) [Siphoviridae sp. ctK0l2]